MKVKKTGDILSPVLEFHKSGWISVWKKECAMMKTRRWKTAVAAFVAVFTAASLVSCSGQSSSTASSDASSAVSGSSDSQEQSGTEGVGPYDLSNLNEPGTIPVLKEKVPLEILIVQDTNIEDLETNEFTKRLEENVNLDLSFEYLPAGSDAKQKFAIMISSGETLPDVLIGTLLSAVEAYSYGSQGYFLPLNDLVQEVGNYSKAYFESEAGEAIMQYVYSPDGNIYGIPRICEDIGNDFFHRMWINKTWLDALNLEMPTTTDEFHDVLEAFKTQDPNGNGKADEIPLVGSSDGWRQNIWQTLSYPFLYLNNEFDYLQVGEDGKLTVSFIQPEFRDALEYMNQLCTEGLLDPLSFTQKQTEFKQLLENEEVQIIGCIPAGSTSVYQTTSKRKEDLTHVPPLTGPDGACYAAYTASSLPEIGGFITKDCADPVAAYAMFDYMYERETAISARWGVKDVDWKEPDEDAVGLYENLGYEPCIQHINYIWGTLQNHHWGEVHPTLRTYDMISGQVWDGNPYDYNYTIAQAIPDYMDKYPEDVVLRLIYTQEEADSIAEFLANRDTMLSETVASFITGAHSLSEWDNFVSDMNALGLEDFLSVAQTAYDRMQQNG